jgi:hypothetical protein
MKTKKIKVLQSQTHSNFELAADVDVNFRNMLNIHWVAL